MDSRRCVRLLRQKGSVEPPLSDFAYACYQDLKSPCFEIPCLCSEASDATKDAATFETGRWVRLAGH